MQFSTIITLLASVAAVHSAAVAEPEVRAVSSLLKRQGLTPAQCAANNLRHCNNSNEPCPNGCICPGGNLPDGGCCAGSC
ncbi:hypothetical protein CkaCkLH20_00841 [Colletotrichum karsti]|uniref:Uncharacterized protein n=1 Tax=Colletotrichum karsti TaxID=1095194 RepID=A0A9P6IJJ7_9PEZI|nr:uncharacterized protein CkaCkLH20_00841 [Colletotrichum karsti]KAF9881695.1 hypothetical protein CkaCkLH20_00841 [Colletotrichum karsti]